MPPERYQPEIDGLRAVAITPVVLFHAGVPGLRGGYVGVDVFFVLSGFLITRLLVAELGATGSVALADFYARRVRRLFPALATVVVAVLVLGTVILSAALERPELSNSAIATMSFVANVYFWHAEATYFALPAGWLPLLNMWTLSVEEQFYLLWPASLLLAAWLGRRAGRSWAEIATPALAVLMVVSLALFWWGTRHRPTAAFYLTPTRVWEFALGGALALGSGRLNGTPRSGGVAVTLGLAGIAAAVVLLGYRLFWGVVVAAFGTAGILMGIALAPAAAPVRVLRARPLVFIGKCSYSWYLWHWPLLVFTRMAAPGEANLARSLLVAFGALVLAAFTYVAVENPIRRRRPWPFLEPRQALAAGAMLSLAVAVLAAGLYLQANAQVRRAPRLAAIAAAARKLPQKPGCNMPQYFSALAPAEQCLVGAPGAPPRVLVWGDSQAEQLAPLLQKDGKQAGYAAAIWSMSSCPQVVPSHWKGDLAAACRAFDHAVQSQLPSLAQSGLTGIVMASRGFGYPSPHAPREVLTAWQSGWRTIFASARDNNLRVLLQAPIPYLPPPLPQCLAHASAAQCGVSRTIVERRRAPLVGALDEIVAGYDNVRIWDPLDFLCNAGTCMPARGGVIAYSDSGHLSIAGARALAPVAAPQFSWLRGQ